MQDKINVLYIVGLSRSGTTYLSKMLTEKLQAISIGESIKNIERFSDESEIQRYQAENRKCTCGEVPENCSFWGGILDSTEVESNREKFKKILRKADALYEDALIIDTSKTTKRLEEFYMEEYRKGTINLVCVNLIRHCYGQINSYQKYHKKKNRRGFRSSVFTDAAYWLYKNRSNIRYFGRVNIPVKTIFYEDLIFNRIEVVQVINEFVGSNLDTYKKHKPTIHEISGNEGFKRSDMNKIKYDTKWFYDTSLFLYSILLWPVLYFNYKWHKKYKVDSASI